MKEQRAHARKLMHERAFLADASGTAWAPTILLDISLSGVSFAFAESLSSGEVRQLRFCLPGSASQHLTFINLVHQTSHGVPSGYKYGARFATISPETIEQIVDFVSKPA